MMSMSGGWFFVVASEAISVGNTTITLPGIGSYIALGHRAAGSAPRSAGRSCTMLVVILALRPAAVPPAGRLGRPFPLRAAAPARAAAILGARRAAPHRALRATADRAVRALWQRRIGCALRLPVRRRRRDSDAGAAVAPGRSRVDRLWSPSRRLCALWRVVRFVSADLELGAMSASAVGSAWSRWLRVVVLIALASVIWVPVGVWVGLRPRARAMRCSRSRSSWPRFRPTCCFRSSWSVDRRVPASTPISGSAR